MLGVFDESYWLPRNTTWAVMPTKASDLFYPMYFTLPMLIFRIALESFVGVPIGWALGYGKGPLLSRIGTHLFGGFASNTRTKRVLECFWRFCFYTSSFSYGVYVLLDKSWLHDVKQCWIGYPNHSIPNEIWWYYMLELTFYYSLLASSVFDVRRSDFWQLIAHHIVTIGLLSVSYAINFVRVGTLVLLSHDIADVILEGGKLLRYDQNKKTATNISFAVFLITWILTRIVYYPVVVIRSAVFEAASLIQPDYEILDFSQLPYAPRITIVMLFCLLVLHVFWTVLILRIVIKTITSGEAQDVRSDVEEEEEERDTKERNKKLTKKRAAKQD